MLVFSLILGEYIFLTFYFLPFYLFVHKTYFRDSGSLRDASCPLCILLVEDSWKVVYLSEIYVILGWMALSFFIATIGRIS